MTTTITVEACSWPVEVRFFPLADRHPLADGDWSNPITIDPHTKRTFHVHDGVDLMVHECPLPATPPARDLPTA